MHRELGEKDVGSVWFPKGGKSLSHKKKKKRGKEERAERQRRANPTEQGETWESGASDLTLFNGQIKRTSNMNGPKKKSCYESRELSGGGRNSPGLKSALWAIGVPFSEKK